jgi:dTDP-4-dehydrorhamnose reductase
MNHIIIGASGLIGGALYDSLSKCGKNVIGTYSSNQKSSRLLRFDMQSYVYDNLIDGISDADVVYIMAAYSNPSWIADNRVIAKGLNLDATIRFIDALKNKNPRIIFMSSVEVFDGFFGGYREFDKPNPLNYYGRLKCQVEDYLRSNYQKSTIVRTGWNIGLDSQSRCVIRMTYESLLMHNARMATDNFFSISDVEDTANALRLLAKYPELREIHICSDEIVRRDEMARLIMKSSTNSSKMAFSPCCFSEIRYSEPRGRVNNLSNALSKEVLGIVYKNAQDIICEKTKFIDRNG